jgi:phage shock protein C
MAQNGRLVRVREGRVVGGVATGLARHLRLDVTLVRLAFVALTFINGIGVLIYLVLWIIMPDEEMAGRDPSDSIRANVEDIAAQAQRAGQQVGDSLRGEGGNRQVQLFIGVALVGLGALFMAQQIGLLSFVGGLGNLLWPLVLIVIGAVLLTRRAREE